MEDIHGVDFLQKHKHICPVKNTETRAIHWPLKRVPGGGRRPLFRRVPRTRSAKNSRNHLLHAHGKRNKRAPTTPTMRSFTRMTAGSFSTFHARSGATAPSAAEGRRGPAQVLTGKRQVWKGERRYWISIAVIRNQNRDGTLMRLHFKVLQITKYLLHLDQVILNFKHWHLSEAVS